MHAFANALLEMDKLKSVYRKSYLADQSRHENSAEHSWHLALAFLTFKSILPPSLNTDHAIKLALAHDICEIGAGDVCAYNVSETKTIEEANYLEALGQRFPFLGTEVAALWHEYEAQLSLESQWVKVFDKLLPFLLNLAAEGRTWQEQNITRTMVLHHNAFIADTAPEIHEWMLEQIELAVRNGWLAD